MIDKYSDSSPDAVFKTIEGAAFGAATGTAIGAIMGGFVGGFAAAADIGILTGFCGITLGGVYAYQVSKNDKIS